jgi:hypothetical protein
MISIVSLSNAMHFLDLSYDAMAYVIKEIDPAGEKKIENFYSTVNGLRNIDYLERGINQNNYLYIYSTIITQPAYFLSCDIRNLALISKRMSTFINMYSNACVSKEYKIYSENVLKILPDEIKNLSNLYVKDLITFYVEKKKLSLFFAPFVGEMNGNREKCSLSVHLGSDKELIFLVTGLKCLLTKENISFFFKLSLQASTNTKKCTLKIEQWISFFKDKIESNKNVRIEGNGDSTEESEGVVSCNSMFPLTSDLFFTLCQMKYFYR